MFYITNTGLATPFNGAKGVSLPEKENKVKSFYCFVAERKHYENTYTM